MIFTAVGTTDFDDLIRAVDDLSVSLPEKVIIQIGRSRYIPQHCEYFRFKPSLTSYYRDSSIVISHGGLGIVTEVLRYGQPLIAVEDPNQPDRHQQQILSVWEKEKYLIWCKDLQLLKRDIERAKSEDFRTYQPPESRIHTVISEFLRNLEQ